MNVNIGDKVVLRSQVGGASGALNWIFLCEEGYHDEPIEIVEKSGDEYIVVLPSGYQLEITKRDIAFKVEA